MGINIFGSMTNSINQNIVELFINIRIQNSFREGYTHNKNIASIVSKVGAGKGTGADSAAFATEVGNELKRAFSENVQPDTLPDERMYRNIAEKIFPPLLKKNHELINTVSKEVAKTTAQKEGLNLNGIDVPIDKNKIDGIVKHASNAPKYENVKKSTENSLVNYSQAVNDESVKKNAEFVGDGGVKAYIIRTTTGKCCEWCTNKAGKYEYGQEPKDIYRRHANCDCVVEYVVDGKSQNVHTKQWATEEEIEARKKIEPPKPTKEDVERLKNLGVENGGGSGIINLPDTLNQPDTQIFRSVGARANNYDIKDLETGDIYHIVEGTKIQNSEVFAGHGVKTKLREEVVEGLAREYNTDKKGWQHCKGIANLDVYGSSEKAEIHWFQKEGLGKVKFKVKRWVDDEG